MKKYLLAVLLCVSMVCLAGCGEQNKEIAEEKDFANKVVVEENAQAVADAFVDHDMGSINEIIFGTNEYEADAALTEIMGETSESNEGALEQIFEYTTIKIERTTETAITYKIEAPDMKNVFANISMDAADISEEELLQHIKDYAKAAETVETLVSLDYILLDNQLVVDYQDEMFINAVTGGLLDAYKSLYEDMMSEYVEGVN